VSLKKIPRDFFLRPTLVVARDLLGKYLCRQVGKKLLVGRVVEVEAYLGSRDPASHSFRGRTKRNEVMFSGGGHLYVYFTYGMHFCANVVTGREGKGEAVLLRAIEAVKGEELMTRRRFGARSRKPGERHHRPEDLCNGPAKICQAFGITSRENGLDVCGTRIWLAFESRAAPPLRIVRSRRIGISRGQEALWRFYVRRNSPVSRQFNGRGTRDSKKHQQ
jgi:DNA-3-methyladenine glycosylase